MPWSMYYALGVLILISPHVPRRWAFRGAAFLGLMALAAPWLEYWLLR